MKLNHQFVFREIQAKHFISFRAINTDFESKLYNEYRIYRLTPHSLFNMNKKWYIWCGIQRQTL